MTKKKARNDNAQIKRVMAILKILCTQSQARKPGQLSKALAEYDIPAPHNRTLKRDIKLLRDELGYEIEGAGRTGYYLQNSDNILPLH